MEHTHPVAAPSEGPSARPARSPQATAEALHRRFRAGLDHLRPSPAQRAELEGLLTELMLAAAPADAERPFVSENALRHRERQEAPLCEDLAAGSGNFADRIDAAVAVQEELAQIPFTPEERLCLVLSGEVTQERLALALDVSVPTVERRVSAARQKVAGFR